jgi:hypothetical protein
MSKSIAPGSKDLPDDRFGSILCASLKAFPADDEYHSNFVHVQSRREID